MAVLEQQYLGKISIFPILSRLVVSADQRNSEWAKNNGNGRDCPHIS